MCSDWRLHQPRVGLNRQIVRALGVSRIDVTAIPGPDGLLAAQRSAEWEAVVGWVKLLSEAHHAAVLALVAHQRCAGHPVTDQAHEKDAVVTARALKEALGFAGPVAAMVAVWHSDSKWRIKVIEWVREASAP
jgi:Putative carbonic anhydrase